ncbi:MAG: large conductance mechanosensitive channel protein MscL [Saprospiraceae bacterium]|nr:large conductance mechanosensitive channel protein MscL [Saprospiraceae bacterium]
MLKEFKEFAFKGNLLDVAIGLVLATAFGKITSAFVDGVFMPIFGQIFQLGDLSTAKFVLSPAVTDTAGVVTTPESAILYGSLIGTVLNFLIITVVMFLIIKGMNAAKKPEPAPVPAGPTQEELLTQIRDLLKK